MAWTVAANSASPAYSDSAGTITAPAASVTATFNLGCIPLDVKSVVISGSIVYSNQPVTITKTINFPASPPPPSPSPPPPSPSPPSPSPPPPSPSPPSPSPPPPKPLTPPPSPQPPSPPKRGAPPPPRRASHPPPRRSPPPHRRSPPSPRKSPPPARRSVPPPQVRPPGCHAGSPARQAWLCLDPRLIAHWRAFPSLGTSLHAQGCVPSLLLATPPCRHASASAAAAPAPPHAVPG